MKNPLVLSCFTGALLLSGQVHADCKQVVENTVAELKAGYPVWNAEMDQLARMAAGAACVKSQSVAAAAPVGLTEESIGGKSGDESVAATDKKEDDEDSWSPFSGIKFNKVNASPSKKPYERRRDVNNQMNLEADEN